MRDARGGDPSASRSPALRDPRCLWPLRLRFLENPRGGVPPPAGIAPPVDTEGWLSNDSPSAEEQTRPFHSATCTAPRGALAADPGGCVLVSPPAGGHPHPHPCPVSQQNTQTLPGQSWGPHLRLLLPWRLVAPEPHGGPVLPPPSQSRHLTHLSFRKLPGA